MRKLQAFLTAVVIGGSVVASWVGFFYYHPDLELVTIFAKEVVRVILFAALAWAAYFVGRLASRFIFRQNESYWEVEIALGFLAFGGGALFLGATHALYPWVVRVAVLVILGFSAPLLWRYGRELPRFLRDRLASLTPGPLILVAVLIPLALAVFVRVGLPPFEWDSLVYHIYIPKVYAEAHELVYLPRLAYASMPLGAEITFTWAYLWGGLGAAASVAPLLNGLMAVATWRLARRYLDNFWAAAAAAFLFVTPVYIVYFTAAYVDMMVGALALMSLGLYLRGLKTDGDAALAGLLLGAALGVKYTGAYAVIGLVPVIGIDLWRRRLSPRHLLIFFAAACVAVAPWFVKSFVERGNPFFPALYNVFGGRDLSPVVAEHLVRWQKGIGMGRGALDYLLLPYRVSFESGPGYGKFDGIILPFSLVALVLSFIWFRRWRLLLYTSFYFVAWAFLASQQLRFLSAAYGTLALISAGLFAAVAALFKRGARNVITVVLVGVVLTFGYVIGGGTTYFYTIEALKYLTSHNGDDYLDTLAPSYSADKFINENLPEEAVILMIFDNHLLYLDRPAIYDSFFEASETLRAVAKMDSPVEVAAYVEGLGATHILTGRYAINYFWSHYQPSTRRLWEAYLYGYTTAIYDRGEFEIRAITPRE